MKKKSVLNAVVIVFSLALLFCFPACVFADENAQGTFIAIGEEGAPAGTAQDPFLISTEQDLIAFATSVNGKYVENGAWVESEAGAHTYEGMVVCLANDIALEAAFTPIGIGMNASFVSATPVCFKGTFNGQGHKISNLFVTSSSNPMFGASYTHGAAWYSALFGSIGGASILNTIVELSPNAKFSVSTSSQEASAGLVAQVYKGENIITCCGVKGDMTGGAHALGGVVGRVDSATLTMSYCYHQGNLVTSSNGGGLISTLNSATVSVTSCYQSGTVSSTNTSANASNFYGQLGGTGTKLTISNCVCTEALPFLGGNMKGTSTNNINAVTNWQDANVKAALDTQYFAEAQDAQTPPELSKNAGLSFTVSFTKQADVSGKLPSLAKQQAGSSFSIPSSNLTRPGYEFVGWKMTEPTQESTDTHVYAAEEEFTMPEGNVVFEAVWKELEATIISTEEELRAFAADVNAGAITTSGCRYKLANDITLHGTWAPIGNYKYPFEGIFDGDGHVIYDMDITEDSIDTNYSTVYAGFFGYVNRANIKNLGVEGSITCDNANYVGGMIGASSGSAAQSSSPEHKTTLSNCFARVTINSAGSVGGLVGRTVRSAISSCYATGSVTLAAEGSCIGGLVGSYWSASISDKTETAVSDCYSAVSVHTLNSQGHAGNLFGEISESYANIDTGSAWNRMTNTYALESNFPAYYTVSTNDTYTAAKVETDALYEKSATHMKDAEFLSVMGSGYKADARVSIRQVNSGYPVLSWEAVSDSERLIEFEINPASASIALTDTQTQEALEPFSSDAQSGIYQYAANPLRSYNVAISATGYEDYNQEIAAAPDDYKASISLSIITYSISYSLSGASFAGGYSAPQSYTVQDSFALPTAENLIKEGYEFLGWKTSFTATDYVTEITQGTTGNISLIAWWLIIPKTPATVSSDLFATACNYYFLTYTGELREGEIPLFDEQAMYWNGKNYVTLISEQAAQSISYKNFSTSSSTQAQTLTSDLNNNNRINVVDAQIAYDMANSVYAQSKFNMQTWLSADVTADGVLDAQDAYAVLHAVTTA